MTDNWLQKSMEQDAQQREVWMPNFDNPQQVNEFTENVRLFIERHGFTNAYLSKKIDISATSLSQFLNGKYPGDSKTICVKLNNFINLTEQRGRQKKEPDYIETSVARAIIAAIRQTESMSKPTEGRISVIVGDAGHGKSVALLAYHKSNPNSIYIKLTTRMSSQAMFSDIAAALKEDPAGCISALTNRIRKNIHDREMTVLIDEASWLDVTKLDQLRQVIVESGCTLILSGNHHLLKTISQDTTRRGYESLDQFRSRMMCVLDLNELASLGDGDGGIYTNKDIEKMFNYGISLTKDGTRELKKIAKTPQTGRLRTCSIIVAAIHNCRQGKDGLITQIDAELIRSAIRSLRLPIRDKIGLFVDVPETEQEDQKAKTA
jgi:DNA transposition AAA+ family ATPase